MLGIVAVARGRSQGVPRAPIYKRIASAISPQQIIRFTPHLVLLGFSGSADRMALFPVWSNPIWRLGRHLGKFKWRYLRNKSSNSLHVWVRVRQIELRYISNWTKLYRYVRENKKVVISQRWPRNAFQRNFCFTPFSPTPPISLPKISQCSPGSIGRWIAFWLQRAKVLC